MRESTMCIREKPVMSIDAYGLSYRDLNCKLREAAENGNEKVDLRNVYGQRYIGTNLDRPVQIDIHGVPGNDLGAFLDGPRIVVYGNAQDGCGNTMNSGEIIVHGHAGDITGLAARGGKIYIKEGVGYRAAVHMKEYGDKLPVLVIGGTAQDFLAEYMAGGIVILLGLNLDKGEHHRAKYIGTGMHGGVIYLRGGVDEYQLGREVGAAELGSEDHEVIRGFVTEFTSHFGYEAERILSGRFIKLFPKRLRPYGRLYAY